jgi:hypothetical protein
MYMHLYMNNPTAGGTDGTDITEGSTLSPLKVVLNAIKNEESAAIKLGIRCESGYKTDAVTTITPTGTSSAMWALAQDNAGAAGTFGAYGAALTLASGIDTTNTIFWIKAKSVDTEDPINDTSVSLAVACSTIVATS